MDAFWGYGMVWFCFHSARGAMEALDFETSETAFWEARKDAARKVFSERAAEVRKAMGIKTQQVVCMYWMKGRCTAEAQCRFLHENDPDKVKLCEFWDGKDGCTYPGPCIYRHYLVPGERPHAPRKDPIRFGHA